MHKTPQDICKRLIDTLLILIGAYIIVRVPKIGHQQCHRAARTKSAQAAMHAHQLQLLLLKASDTISRVD